jgi:alpha-amylase/alpha-mannosidase (GH57 family)
MVDQLVERCICIHGHFYQPPRENPWLEEVEFQESAKPYHDWNERVTAECYAPNAVSRVMDRDWRIIGLINNYSRISFNFGPTLLYWLDRHRPEVYRSILDADRESMNNYSGHGSAIAQIYNHMIMPLANRRDKETQVKWAIRDFEVRFGRFPEGMWLPETAVDVESLEVLSENGIKFTILSPHQASKMRRLGQQEWVDVSGSKIDPRYPYLCRLPSGHSIILFFFDKRTAIDIAFGNLLANGEAFAKRLVEALNGNSGAALIESVASDGELYGHHHPHGDMTLAYCIYHIVANEAIRLTNYGEFLERHPAESEVEIVENTSWSCIHGVERWRSDCGDNMGHEGWKQGWRKPLREAMDWLRDEVALRYEQESSKYLNDPWQVRNDYIDVILDRASEHVESFLSKHAKYPLSTEDKRRVIKLLEMQRHAMLMYTSCGWFFDEISGIETIQVMMYAARVMQLVKELFGVNLEGQYLDILETAPSNIPEFKNGARVFDIFVKPSVVDFAKIGAQNTIRELFFEGIKNKFVPSQLPNCSFRTTPEVTEKYDDGKFRLIVNRTSIYSQTTLDEETFSCAAIWLGDHNVTCGARSDMRKKAFNAMRDKLVDCFNKGQINEIIVWLSKYYGQNSYSLKDVFRDDQSYILDYIVADGQKKAKDLYDIIYHDNSAMLRFMKENRIPSPRPLLSAAEIVLNMEIGQLLESDTTDLEQLRRLLNDMGHLSVTLDSVTLGFQASQKITTELNQLASTPGNIERLNTIVALIRMIKELPIELNLWESQNIVFKMSRNQYQAYKQNTDEASASWVSAFWQLCDLIGIRLE